MPRPVTVHPLRFFAVTGICDHKSSGNIKKRTRGNNRRFTAQERPIFAGGLGLPGRTVHGRFYDV